MNWNKLPKEKKQQLVIAVVLTVAVLAGLGFGLIKYQFNHLARLSDKKALAEKSNQDMDNSIKHRAQLQADVEKAQKELAILEESMASGDLYSSLINSIRRFRAGYKVEIPSFGASAVVADCNLLPGFPYKQVTISVSGTAHYHDLGRFIADFENKFPHARIVNLDLELNTGSPTGEREKLGFRMEIITLIKPT